MIQFIRGKLVSVEEDRAIVEVNGVGYGIFMSVQAMSRLPRMGAEVKIHTYLNVKEDAMQLFGFLSKDDMEIFKLLLGVNGVGPKAALGILSVMSADDIRFAVLADDAKTISKAPGIGTKTARKLILELRDKVSLEDAFEKRLENQAGAPVPTVENDAVSEAVQALTALGYSSADALKAVRKADIAEGMTTEEILKSALKNMSFL